jgi:hypothetical protein
VIAEEFSRYLRGMGAIPYDEVNDGVILAEASLGNATLLVSSDSHLTSIHPGELVIYFESKDLVPVPVITPKDALRFLENPIEHLGCY